MRTIIFFLLFCFGFSVIHAQQDSLQQEILNYSNSKTQIITSGRSLLLDKFIERDLQKVEEVRDYLVNEVQNEDYLALYPGEDWLLLYWTGDYRELLRSITNFDEAALERLRQKIQPNYDMLFAKLREGTLKGQQQVTDSLSDANLSSDEQDFLLLYLEYLLTDPEDPLQEQERINKIADSFLASHPNSVYEDYVRENIRFRFIPSNWGFAFEFFSGYGHFTGNLTNEFQNNIPMGIAFDIEYKRLTLYLRNYIGFSFTKNERPYEGGTWKEDSQVRVYLPEASFGYSIVDNNRFKISPFAGLASTSISPTEVDISENPGVEEAGLDFTTTYTIGFNMDYKLNWGTDLITMDKSKQSYWFIRLRYGYSAPQFQAEYAGNMHYVTLGLGGIYRGTKRQL